MRSILILVAMLLPTGLSDQMILGVPDLTCQTLDEMRTHDYGPVLQTSDTRFPRDFLLFAEDGNLETCAPPGTYYNHEISRPAIAGLGRPGVTCDSLPAQAAQDWCEEPRPGDYDHDLEYASGGAILFVSTGDGHSSGTWACRLGLGHHPQGGLVTVTDLVAGGRVLFTVNADYTHPATPVPIRKADCGDDIIQPCESNPPEPSSAPEPVNGVVDTVQLLLHSLQNSPELTCNPQDVTKWCISSCVADFAPGIDGTYVVLVEATLSGLQGEPGVPTQGHIYL